MPVFMDIHIGQDLTAEDVALAHRLDIEMQDDFRCKCLTYWADEERGNAYCLINAPNKSAVIKLHKNSHKQLPDEIIEVDKRVVKAFLGRIHDPEVVDYMIDQKIKVFNDPAFRVILIVQTKDEKLLRYHLGNNRAKQLLREYNNKVQHLIGKHNGVQADIDGQEFIASFVDGYDASLCAIEVEKSLKKFGEKIGLRICVHAGNPVDQTSELFGTTLMLARFLCNTADNNQVIITSTVKRLLNDTDGNRFTGLKFIRYLSSEEQQFLAQLVLVIQSNWQKTNFEIENFCKAMSASKSHLYRKCVDTTGMSPKRLLGEYKLKKAQKMLDSSIRNVSQTAFDAGFSSPSYFAKCFHKRFGVQPTTYLNN